MEVDDDVAFLNMMVADQIKCNPAELTSLMVQTHFLTVVVLEL